MTDVITSYKDLLPEPAGQYAEIVRLNAPDFHPTVESFDLTDALTNPAQAPLLHAMDTLRIFSRFDFENPPTVSVWGDAVSYTHLDVYKRQEYDVAYDVNTPGQAYIQEITQEQPPQLLWQMNVDGQPLYRGFRIPSLYPGVVWTQSAMTAANASPDGKRRSQKLPTHP